MLVHKLGDGDGHGHGPSQNEDLTVHPHCLAVKLLVGAGARLLFYPTLFYNVVRNKFEAEFRWWDEIEQFLLLGAVPFQKDVLRLKNLGVEAVITLNESYETLVSSSYYERQMIQHLVIPTRDYLFAPSFDDIQRAVGFIHENVEQKRTVYVHCKAGRGRSTTIVICYLVKFRGMSPFDAFHYVCSKRPRVLLAGAQWKAVSRFSKCQHFEATLPQEPAMYRCLQVAEDARLNQHNTPCCGELPVFVTLSDIEDYQETKVSKLRGKMKVVYKVSRGTVNSVISLAKTSLTLARSYIWFGYKSGV